MNCKPPSQRRADLMGQLRGVTCMIVRALRRRGRDELSIRSDVAASFKDALGETRPSVKRFDFGEGHGPRGAVTLDGIYWLTLARPGIDRSNLHLQERWWAIVEG